MRTVFVGLLVALIVTLPLTATAAPAAEAGPGFHSLPDWLATFLGWLGIGPAGVGELGPHIEPNGAAGEDPELGPHMDPHGLVGPAFSAGSMGEDPELGPHVDPHG